MSFAGETEHLAEIWKQNRHPADRQRHAWLETHWHCWFSKL